MKFSKAFLFIFAVLFFLLLNSSIGITGELFVQQENKATSVGWGLYTPPSGFGSPENLVFVGNPLSNPLASTIGTPGTPSTGSAIFDPAFAAQLLAFGTLTKKNVYFRFRHLIKQMTNGCCRAA